MLEGKGFSLGWTLALGLVFRFPVTRVRGSGFKGGVAVGVISSVLQCCEVMV